MDKNVQTNISADEMRRQQAQEELRATASEWVEAAMSYWTLGMVNEAIAELKRIPTHLRTVDLVLEAKARVFMRAKRWQESLLFWKLFQRHDRTGLSFYSASLCLFHLRRYDEAREIMLLAMPEAGSWKESWWNLACIEVGRGRLKAAQHAARMAVQRAPEVLDRLLADPDLDPIHPFLQTLRPAKESVETDDSDTWGGSRLPSVAPVCAAEQGESPDEDWGACTAFPQEYQVFLDRARGYADLEMFEDAETELYRVPYHFRSSVKFIRSLAYVLSLARRWSEVIPLYKQLCQLVPHAISPRYNLAHSLSAIGLFKNALTVLEMAPRHPILQAKKDEIQRAWEASKSCSPTKGQPLLIGVMVGKTHYLFQPNAQGALSEVNKNVPRQKETPPEQSTNP